MTLVLDSAPGTVPLGSVPRFLHSPRLSADPTASYPVVALVMFTGLHPLGGSRDSDPQFWTYSSCVNAHSVLPECMYK